ncbi:hypothetical protein TNCV_1390171 [Trichonephila clavipes]|nr:hypothetical protein TNCV_1390171 [Trichonephila clavipes]
MNFGTRLAEGGESRFPAADSKPKTSAPLGSNSALYPFVVAHYPVGMRLMTSAESMGGPQAPKPQRRSDVYSVYRQCVLEECGSEIQYRPKP